MRSHTANSKFHCIPLPGPASVNEQNNNERSALKKSLTIATVIMMGSVLLSRIIGLVREQVIAHLCGTSTEIDAYVTAFIVPELINHFLASGFLSITFIPMFQRYLHQNDREGAWRSFSNLMSLGTIAFAVVIPLSMALTPPLLRLLGPNITNPETFPLTVKMTRIILPAQMFIYWGAFFLAVQMAVHRFVLPALTPLLYNIGIITGGIVLIPFIGVEGLAWGVLAGAFAGNVVIGLIGARRIGMRYRFRIDLRHRDVREYLLLSLPLVIGVGMSYSNEILFRFFSSYLEKGDTASINYALRTMGAVVALFGQASGVAFFPYLSRFALEGKFSEISILLNKAITRIALFCIPLSALCIVLSRQIIAILYEHGRFTEVSTERTAPVFALYMVGAFAFSVAVFVVRPFYAIRKMYTPMVVSTLIAVASLPLYYFASKWWGARGVASSATAGMILQFLILYGIWFQRHGERSSTVAMIKRCSSIVGITAIAMAAVWIIGRAIPVAHFGLGKAIDYGINGSIIALIFGVIVFGLYQITGVMKLKELYGMFRSRK
jgi:putative peptidoglycan lipid II flippase